jgi:hypothetical protein
MDKYIGVVNNAKITMETVIETLDSEKAFIQKKYVLTLEDETSFPLQVGDYYEFRNNVASVNELKESDIDPKIKGVILTLWGKE